MSQPCLNRYHLCLTQSLIQDTFLLNDAENQTNLGEVTTELRDFGVSRNEA